MPRFRSRGSLWKHVTPLVFAVVIGDWCTLTSMRSSCLALAISTDGAIENNLLQDWDWDVAAGLPPSDSFIEESDLFDPVSSKASL